MKSPLVEALRQADSNAANEPQAAKAPVEDHLAKSPEEPVLPPTDDAELSLMESTALRTADAAADLDDEKHIAGDIKDESGEEAGIALDGPTMPRPADAVLASAVANRPSRMPRIGLFSPLLCLVLALATGTLNSAFQRLGGSHENVDLAALPTLSRPNAEAPGTTDIATNPGRFQLIVGPQAAPSESSTRENPEPAARTSAGSAAESPALRAEADQRTSGGGASKVSSALAAPGFEDRAFDTLVAAHAAYRNGEYAVAEAGYRRALELAPQHPNALQGLAAILEKTGRQDESMRHYAALLSVDPGNTAAAAAVLAASNNDVSDIKHLVREHPESPQLHFALGAAHAGQLRWPEARQAFDAALRLDPRNADYLFNLAVSLEHLGMYLDARHYYEAALAAADATSSLDSTIVMARIDELAVLDDNGSVIP